MNAAQAFEQLSNTIAELVSDAETKSMQNVLLLPGLSVAQHVIELTKAMIVPDANTSKTEDGVEAAIEGMSVWRRTDHATWTLIARKGADQERDICPKMLVPGKTFCILLTHPNSAFADEIYL